MADGNRPSGSIPSVALLTVVVVVVVVAVLYFARTVLIPLALALLLAFLLSPLVSRLRHWHLGRIPSAVSVVLLAFGVLGIFGSVLVSQLTDLAHKLPAYEHNIHEKVQSIRASGGGAINRISRVIGDLTVELTPTNTVAQTAQESRTQPVPVEIRRSPFSPVELVQRVLGSAISALVTAGIVIVFVIFMLIEQEDLRDRLIRLGGTHRVSLTTEMLDDAAGRISRYLLAQLVVNASFGLLAGLGLYFLRVPNPLLWGLLAALFRYIPYLGIWVAATMPAAVALAVDPAWAKVPLVFGLYFGIDVLMYNFAEPFLYGSSTGLSALAILVAAVSWTWLWGPVGLLLATPLTVCVVVLGRHVPSLAFLRVLLSDEPMLAPGARFYQRLLAMDLDEATALAEEFLTGKSLEQLYDQVIIPALSLAEEDRHRGAVDGERQRFIVQTARMLIEDLAERGDAQIPKGEPDRGQGSTGKSSATQSGGACERIDAWCLPARDEADELVALMLGQSLQRRGLTVRVLPSGGFAGELHKELERQPPEVACVVAVPPFGYLHARWLCRRLRARSNGLKLVGAVLTEGDVSELKRRQPPLAVDEFATSIAQAVDRVAALHSAGCEPESATEARAA